MLYTRSVIPDTDLSRWDAVTNTVFSEHRHSDSEMLKRYVDAGSTSLPPDGKESWGTAPPHPPTQSSRSAWAV